MADLLRRLKEELPRLTALSDQIEAHESEDLLYRFYHHSFKVYRLQNWTAQIVAALQRVQEDRKLNALFLEIVSAGTGKKFTPAHNRDWARHTRPIVEAFFHARFFLTVATEYASLPTPPTLLPSGWAALLTLYGLR